MFPVNDAYFIGLCLEAFFYGTISIPCALNCTLAKKNPGLGLYSGIFAIYLQCPSNKFNLNATNIVFYALCLLYILSTATVASDLVVLILGVSNYPI